MERKIKVKKDNVIKEIDENIVSLYQNVGWTKVEEKNIVKDIIKKNKED